MTTQRREDEDASKGTARPTPAAPAETEAAAVVPIAIDLYGIKAKARPASGGDHPMSWREVGRGLNRYLMKICLDLGGVAADALAAMRGTLVSIAPAAKGASKIFGAAARRISRGRVRADSREDQRQAEAASAAPHLPGADESMERLLAKLQHYRALGLDVTLKPLPGGRFILIVSRLELGATAAELAEDALEDASGWERFTPPASLLSLPRPETEDAKPESDGSTAAGEGGATATPKRKKTKKVRRSATKQLSPRERQVLEKLLNGSSEKEVAVELDVSANTVHQYVKRLYQAFGVQSRSALLARFIPHTRPKKPPVPQSEEGGVPPE